MESLSWIQKEKIISIRKQNYVLDMIRSHFPCKQNINIGLLTASIIKNEDCEPTRYLIFLSAYNPILLAEDKPKYHPNIFCSTSIVSVPLDFLNWMDKKWIENINRFDNMKPFLFRSSVLVSNIEDFISGAFDFLPWQRKSILSQPILQTNQSDFQCNITMAGPYSLQNEANLKNLEEIISCFEIENGNDSQFQKFITENKLLIQNFSFSSIMVKITNSGEDVYITLGGLQEDPILLVPQENKLYIPTSIRCSSEYLLVRLWNLYQAASG